MDRRKFLVGAGSLGAVASGGMAAMQSGGAARAEGLAKAARGTPPPPPTLRPPTYVPTVEGMVLGYLPGSAAFVNEGAAAPRSAPRWVAWDKSMSPPSSSVRRVLGAERMVNVAIGGMQRAVGGPEVQAIRSVQVVAHFATADSNFAPFFAWSFAAAGPKRVSASPGLSFDAYTPDRMALQVDYALDAAAVNRDVKPSGMIYLPVGSLDGPGAGIYVLAGPSRATGTQPNLAGYIYSGDPLYPIVNTRNAEPDFDYVTVTIRLA